MIPRVSLRGPCPQNLKKLTVAAPNKLKTTIHRIHQEHAVCRAFIEIVNAETGSSLVYSGESPGAVYHQAFEATTGPTKRQAITPEL